MNSKTLELGRLLPVAQFGEHHVGIVDADIESTWTALHQMRWSDLRWTKPFVAARGLLLTGRADEPCLSRFWQVAAVTEDPPRRSVFVMVGQPWSPVPRSVPLTDVAEAERFSEPGWLKYGMEWVLHPLPEGRTAIETRTLCQATDASARRRFRAYWTIIRPFSGLLRMEMIATIGRLAGRTSSPTEAPA